MAKKSEEEVEPPDAEDGDDSVRTGRLYVVAAKVACSLKLKLPDFALVAHHAGVAFDTAEIFPFTSKMASLIAVRAASCLSITPAPVLI